MKDAKIFAPRPGKQQRIAVSGVAARTALRTTLLGKGWVRVKAQGTPIDFQFGSSTVTLPVINSVANDDTVGWTLDIGESIDYYLTTETHVSWVGAGGGFLLIGAAGARG